jgi:hypothetical protein
MLLEICEFCDNRRSERRIFLVGANKIPFTQVL